MNLANIKLEVLQPTILKWSRGWYENVNIWKKLLHKICPNYIWATEVKGSLFRVVYKSKSRIYQMLNWKYCSPHYLNSHVTEIKRWLHKWLYKSKLDLHHRYKAVLFLRCLLVEKSNLAYITLKVLQFTFLNWSRDWYWNIYILKKWLHDFCTNLVLTIDIKKFLF